MEEAYAGIDVAFAKNKRLPLVVCLRRERMLEPIRLRRFATKPPVGHGNARIVLDRQSVARFADDTAAYLRTVESIFKIRIRRVAIDAPSDPKVDGASRRQCEIGLDQQRISCITTPSLAQFEAIRKKASRHLELGGAESRIPAANQLWMLVGFALFRRLRQDWECLEVFPQAIASVLGAHHVHKSIRDGLLTQLEAVAKKTHWPIMNGIASLTDIGYGSYHDRLDAYLSAWVASLDDSGRLPIGNPPNDAIWIPDISKTL